MIWWRRNWIDALMVLIILALTGILLAFLLRGSQPRLFEGTVDTPPSTSSNQTSETAASANPAVRDSTSSAQTNNNASNPAASTLSEHLSESEDPPVIASRPIHSEGNLSEQAHSPNSSEQTQTQPSTQSSADSRPTSETAQQPTSQTPLHQRPTNEATPEVKPPARSTADTSTTAAQTTAPQTTTPQQAPTTRNQAATTQPPTRANYRIGVAAYVDTTRAERLATSIRAQGLPAFALPTENNLTVVVLGPYSDETTARKALDELRLAYPDAILYRPQGATSQSASPQGTNTQTTSPATRTQTSPNRSGTAQASSQNQTPPTTHPAPANSNTTRPEEAATRPNNDRLYLQAGAFRSIESARSVLQEVEATGQQGFIREGTDGLLRVIVGPVKGDELETVKSGLQARGLAPFLTPASR